MKQEQEQARRIARSKPRDASAIETRGEREARRRDDARRAADDLDRFLRRRGFAVADEYGKGEG